jgi:5-methylcytosine-specific restriction endonuclease McrA
MTEIYIGKGQGGSERKRYVHKIYVDNPHDQSYTSYVLLRNELLLQDTDYIESEWKQRVEFSRQYLRARLKKDGHLTCQYCSKTGLVIEEENMKVPDKIKATIDHIVPLSKGGSLKDYDNIVIACYRCNTKKGSKNLHDFLTRHNLQPEWALKLV